MQYYILTNNVRIENLLFYIISYIIIILDNFPHLLFIHVITAYIVFSSNNFHVISNNHKYIRIFVFSTVMCIVFRNIEY